MTTEVPLVAQVNFGTLVELVWFYGVTWLYGAERR